MTKIVRLTKPWVDDPYGQPLVSKKPKANLQKAEGKKQKVVRVSARRMKRWLDDPYGQQMPVEVGHGA